MILSVRVSVTALILAIAPACDSAKVTENAEIEISEFQSNFEAGNVSAIWRSTHPEFRTVVQEGQFSTMLADFRNILGEIRSTKREALNISSLSGSARVQITMRTQFANAEGVEEFEYRELGDELRLASYAVQSPALNDYDYSKFDGPALIYEAPPQRVE